MRAQRGFTLAEALVACGIAAFALTAFLGSTAAFVRFGSHAAGPNRSRAISLAEQTLHVAQDAWKYGVPGNAPAGSFRTDGASVNVSLTPISESSAQVTVSVAYTPDPGRADDGVFTISSNLIAKAPLPAARIERPGLVPKPPGIP